MLQILNLINFEKLNFVNSTFQWIYNVWKSNTLFGLLSSNCKKNYDIYITFYADLENISTFQFGKKNYNDDSD